MPTFYSPDGNAEVWEAKPDGYYTVEEWEALHPTPKAQEPDKNAVILMQIEALEMQQTRRRMREAALTEEGRLWLENLDARIEALREQLT